MNEKMWEELLILSLVCERGRVMLRGFILKKTVKTYVHMTLNSYQSFH